MSTRTLLQGNTILPVAGAKAYPDAVAALKTGETVQIVPEPTNPHDGNAMRIIDSGNRTVGYLPAAVAARIVSDLGSAPMVAKVAEVTFHEGRQVGARIRVCAILDRVA